MARQLANGRTRQDAVEKIQGLRNDILPILLTWTQKPPSHIDQYQLDIGLADAFGELKAEEAIPFLLKNITLNRDSPVDLAPWLKRPEVVEATYPAVAALIKIGPAASGAVIHMDFRHLGHEERLAAILVVSRVKGVPEARAFLSSALGQANLELLWAEEGLRALDEAE